MKVLLLSASPRKDKSNSFLLAKEVLAGYKSIMETEEEVVHLLDMQIQFCRHCDYCHRHILACPLQDDTIMILKKMLEAKAIIFATPNYLGHISAGLKALLERSTHFIHCKRLTGKYTVAAAVCGSGKGNQMLSYLKCYSNLCGSYYVGGVSSTEPISSSALNKGFVLGRRLAMAVKKKTRYLAQERAIKKSHLHFRNLILRKKQDWQEEYNYWASQNWLK